jgi:5-formyltetrahydrofolate cyclo-ligase
MRERRGGLFSQTPDAARRAAACFPIRSLPAFAVAAAYFPMGSELDPTPLAERLAAAGARLALPAAEQADAPLVFRAWAPGDPLEPDAAGVPSPGPAAAQLTPDLVIAPVLAFDRRGGRLGQGGGHYDRTLENLRASRAVFVVGLAFSGQELDHIPLQPHDQRLDAILTEAEFISVGG